MSRGENIMNIKMIKGDLINQMPEYVARGNWSELIGAGFYYQITDVVTSEQITFIEVLDNNKWDEHMSEAKIESLNSIEEVNSLISTNNVDIYEGKNDALINANLTYLVSQRTIPFEDLKVDMTEQEELAYLYSKGCSGISKRKKYQLL